MEISVLVDEAYEEKLETDWMKNAARQTLEVEGVSPSAEMGIFITTQEAVQKLNRDYLGKDRPTDVISFYMEDGLIPAHEENSPSFITPPDGMLHLGEVIISYPQAVTQAEEQGHSVNREITILIIHGVLHLLGYEDETPELKQEMAAKEKIVLGIIEGAKN